LGASEIQILLATLEYEIINTTASGHLLMETYCSDPSSLDGTKTNNKEIKEDKTDNIHPPMPLDQ
jgi:hypothetical protein